MRAKLQVESILQRVGFMNIDLSLDTGGPILPVFYKVNYNKDKKCYKVDWLFFRLSIYNRYKYYET